MAALWQLADPHALAAGLARYDAQRVSFTNKNAILARRMAYLFLCDGTPLWRRALVESSKRHRFATSNPVAAADLDNEGIDAVVHAEYPDTLWAKINKDHHLDRGTPRPALARAVRGRKRAPPAPSSRDSHAGRSTRRRRSHPVMPAGPASMAISSALANSRSPRWNVHP